MLRRWVLAVVVLAGGAAAAADKPHGAVPDHPSRLRFSGQPITVPEAAAYRHQLSNGVPVYIVEDHATPWVDVAIALRAGDYLDPPAAAGLAGMTALMLRRGGTATLGPEEVDERLDFLAADVDTSAGGVRAGASLGCTSAVLGESLDLFFDLLRHPRFDAARLDLAKANLLASFRQRTDDPLAVLSREWGYLLFDEQHFSQRELSPADLPALTPAALAAFHARYWQPRGMVLAVSGDVVAAEVLPRLERAFAGWEVGAPAAWPPPAPQIVFQPGLYHLERDLPQGKVILGHLGARRDGWDDPDFYALTVLSELLGGNAVSRIGGRLRTVEGLAYRAGGSLGVGEFWPGELRVFLESKNETVALAIKLAREELSRLRVTAPVKEELRLAQRSIVDGLPLMFDSAEEIAGYFAEDEYLGRPHSFWRDYRGRIERVRPEDVQRVAARNLAPDRLAILVVGRWREIEPGDRGRRASMSDFYGGAVKHLPERDPLTLQPRR